MKKLIFTSVLLVSSLLSSGANAAYVASLSFIQPTGTVGPTEAIPVRVRLTLDDASDPLSTDGNGKITSPFQSLLDAQGILASQITNTYVNTYYLCSGNFTNVCSPDAYSFNFAFNSNTPDPTSLVFPTNLNVLPGSFFDYDFGTFVPNGGPAALGNYKFFGSGATLNFNYDTVDDDGNPVNRLYTYTLAQTCSDGDPDCSFSRTVTAAVPEPATWLMMIFGFGLVGGAMRYRQRQSAKISFS